MLSLVEGFSIRGVDFFRDDEAKDTFYYLPNKVELARNADGSPQFPFVLYQAGLPIERIVAWPQGKVDPFWTACPL